MTGSEGILRYRPGNGSEGAEFVARWCGKCTRDLGADAGDGCPILALTFVHPIDAPEYPEAWRRDGPSGPRCTSFEPIDASDIPLDPAAAVGFLL